jgi:hypothetical protein
LQQRIQKEKLKNKKKRNVRKILTKTKKRKHGNWSSKVVWNAGREREREREREE